MPVCHSAANLFRLEEESVTGWDECERRRCQRVIDFVSAAGKKQQRRGWLGSDVQESWESG